MLLEKANDIWPAFHLCLASLPLMRLMEHSFFNFQVRFKQTNSHFNLKTNVSVITLDIEDHLGNCGRFVNENGSLDINQVGAKILWNEGHSVTGLPTDIFCMTDAHCHTLYNSKIVRRLLNQTVFDLAIVDLIGNECSSALAA